MTSATSRRRLAPLVLAIVVLPLALYRWAARDVVFDGESASLVSSMPLRPRSPDFAKLSGLAEQVRSSLPEWSRLPRTHEANRTAADAALETESARRLPRAVEDLFTSVPAGAVGGSVDIQVAAPTWSAASTMVRLFALQIQKQLSRKEPGVWETGRPGLQFVRFMVSQARSFSELASAELSCAELFRALSTAMDARALTDQQLGELEELLDWSGPAREVIDATRSEYSVFENQLIQAVSQERGLFSGLFLQPNRTRREWLATMAGAVNALQRGDVVRAHDALAATPAPKRTFLRNSVGTAMVGMSTQGVVPAFAQSVDLVAAFGLLKVRAAMARYREQNGRSSRDIADIRGNQRDPLPGDPWAQGAPFRFSQSNGRLYSIGRDRHDDHGTFERDFFYGRGASDLGLRLSDR